MADVTVTAANVIDAGTDIERNYRAGEALTAGQPVYVKSTDGFLYKAQADGTADEAAAIGVSVSGGAIGQRVFVQTGGEYTVGGTVVVGTEYVVSATAGGICPKGDLVSTNKYTSLGYATLATKLKLTVQVTGLIIP